VIDITDFAALRRQIGQEVAVGEWLEITQDRISQFAEATEDRQWIHVDPARAAGSPFKSTIAHGFLTLSLVSALLRSAIRVPNQKMGINYGVNRVRFPAPVPAGSRVRGRFSPLAVDDVNGAHQVTWAITVERDGGDKPCCVAEWIVRYYV
jgi:acyl dehydratase